MHADLIPRSVALGDDLRKRIAVVGLRDAANASTWSNQSVQQSELLAFE